MTDGKQPKLDDAALTRLLSVLRPPAPSDLLRARVARAIFQAPVLGQASGADLSTRNRTRTPFYGRLAASMVLIAAVALAALIPPSPRADVAAIPQLQASGQGSDLSSEFGLTLVGNGAPVSSIPLVRADWPSAGIGADDGPGIGSDNSNELEAIPLY